MAHAKTLTIGSPLTGTYQPTPLGGPGTFAFRTIDEPGALIFSPAGGTLVSWRFTGGVGGPFRLRVLHPASEGIENGVGTSAPVIPSGPGPTAPLATKLPIAKGDTIGIDNSSFDDRLGAKVPTTSATFYAWYPPLLDGGPSRGGQPGSGELGFSAVVRYCRVPDLIGKKLRAALHSLKASDCRPGRIRPKRRHRQTRFVVAQGRAVGRSISDTTRVSLRLGPKD